MKITYALLCLASFSYGQQYEAPKQLSALKTYVNTQTCLKLIADPACVPTFAIACCLCNECNVSCPVSTGLGAVISYTVLGYATECDDIKFPYISINTLAAIKRNFFKVFPCMGSSISVTKKTD